MNYGRQRFWLIGATALLIGVLLASGSSRLLAQDATPAANDTEGYTGYGGPAATAALEAGTAPHPAHIHNGGCATLDPNPVFPLANVMAVATDSGAADQPEVSLTTVNVSLQELLAAPHAINVHDRASNLQRYIACGDITGTPLENGGLAVVLRQQNASSYLGVAYLVPNATNAAQTDVSVFLVLVGAGQRAAATPAA